MGLESGLAALQSPFTLVSTILKEDYRRRTELAVSQRLARGTNGVEVGLVKILLSQHDSMP